MLSRVVASRKFASAVRSPLLPSAEESVRQLPNGLTVASIDVRGAVSQLLVAFKAGTRYEQPNELGLVHHLRNCIGIDSNNYLGVKLLWQSGTIGSTLISSASKDLFGIQMSVDRTFANIGLSLLGEFAQPALKPWDTEECFSRLQIDIDHQRPYDLLIEGLHRAAYRNGPLANPLLAAPDRVQKVSASDVAAFAESRLVTSQAVLVGVNVDSSLLFDYASTQNLIREGTTKVMQPSPYYGGNWQTSGNTSLAHVAIAGEGAKLTDSKSVATFALLSYIIGKGSNVKFGNSVIPGAVTRAVFKAANHNAVAVNALNIVHTDSGLAGVYLVAEGDKIQSYVKVAVDALKGLATAGVDAESLTIAKKFAKLESSVNATNTSSLANDTATQLLATGTVTSPVDFSATIDAVNVDDIKKAAAQVVSQLSVSAYGKVNQVPYSDQL